VLLDWHITSWGGRLSLLSLSALIWKNGVGGKRWEFVVCGMVAFDFIVCGGFHDGVHNIEVLILHIH